MALPDYARLETGTGITFKSSGGTAAITLASLANTNGTSTGGRESGKVDLGATRAAMYDVYANFELAATPTAGNSIDLHWNPSSSNTAATDNRGGCGGTDAGYSGYSSNLDASVKQLVFIGSFICTAQATTTVQKCFIGRFSPQHEFGSLVVVNRSGAAFHSSDTNCVVTMYPVTDKFEDT